jgi:O-antigen ligase
MTDTSAITRDQSGVFDDGVVSSADVPVGRVDPVESRSFLARRGLSTSDALVLTLAGVWCIAYGPFFVVTSWTPRIVLMLAALPAGVVALLQLVRSGDRSARWAVAALTVCVVSALLSADPRAALVGFYGMETSTAIVLGAFAMWALCRQTSDAARRIMPLVLVAGLAINGFIGLLQVVLRIQSGDLGVEPGRASGLTPNPVYFGALMAAATALCAAHALRTAQLAGWTLGVASFSVLTAISGGRIALGALVIGVVVALAGRGGTSRTRLSVGAASCGGVVVGILLSGHFSSTSVAERAVDSGLTGRLEAWRFGMQAFTERPLLGWGIGRFRAAAQSHFDAAFVRRYAPNELVQAWFDPHNIVVNLLVGVGIVGTAVFVSFAISVARRSRGPLAIAAAVLAVSWLVQPAALATFPLAMLMLGGATGPMPVRQTLGIPGRIALTGLAATLVVWVGGVDLAMRHAIDHGTASDAARVARWMPGDPLLSDVVSQLWVFEALDDPAVAPQAIEWAQRVVDAQPDRPYWWSRLAARQLMFGRASDAKASLERALELSPWGADTWTLMLAYADLVDDRALEARAHDVVCVQLELETCPD